MTPTLIVFAYLGAVAYLGIFAFRRRVHSESHKGEAADFFVAGRSIGGAIFLLSIFGTHMTAFAILGSSGYSFHNGIVTYGLMASSSALIVPLLLLYCGTRIWSLGKRHGFLTPVQMFRDRWECGHIGTVIVIVQALLLVPYIVIGVMGGGTALRAISGGIVPFWLGGAIVAAVVMSYVFFGGMRGTAWVNAFQTALFLCFGAIAVGVIGHGMGGFSEAIRELQDSPLLTRERISPRVFFSYTFIPLSAIAFPHISIFCLTAARVTQFKRTVILYPLCMLVVWLPCVLLGVAANRAADDPRIASKIEARADAANPALPAADRAAARARMSGDDVLLILLDRYSPAWLAGLLGAGIMAAVMASDSQILALSTLFTEDVLAYYGRFDEGVQVQLGRAFVVAVTAGAYAIAMIAPQSIFDIAVQWAFSGYAAMSVLVFAALFWKRSTKWGALAATLFTASAVTATAFFPGPVWGFLPAMPMTLGAAAMMIGVSLVTAKPSAATLSRYFETSRD